MPATGFGNSMTFILCFPIWEMVMGILGLSGVSGGRGRECVRVPRDVLASYILSAHHVLGRVISMAGLAQ